MYKYSSTCAEIKNDHDGPWLYFLKKERFSLFYYFQDLHYTVAGTWAMEMVFMVVVLYPNLFWTCEPGKWKWGVIVPHAEM